jgi:hypothetical protein
MSYITGLSVAQKIRNSCNMLPKKFVTSNFSGHEAECLSENYTVEYILVAKQRPRNKPDK